MSESSRFILDIEEPFGFLFEHHETGWEDLPQEKFGAQLFYLEVVVPESWLWHHLWWKWEDGNIKCG